MRIHWKEVLTALAAGVLLGWFAAFGAVQSGLRGCGPEGKLEHFSRELGLDAGQKEKVGKILSDTREKIVALRNENKPRFEAIRAESRERIAALLTPAQNEKFKKLEAQKEIRRHKRKARFRPEGAPSE